mmetsp:Transcript_97000/g.301955  ORF Transcript_97000/g.301955 Transcript_97000/m.301955 type:complete len:201 (-) Transcript_97000:472-1074(-)
MSSNKRWRTATWKAAECIVTNWKRLGPWTRSKTSITSPDWGSTHAPWKSTMFGCLTLRSMRISFAMATRCFTLARSAACFVVLTATGVPCKEPHTTTPNEPAPRTWSAAIFKSKGLMSQFSLTPRAATFSRLRFSASARSSGMLSSQRSTSTPSKMRPVAVVSGLDERTDRISSCQAGPASKPSPSNSSSCCACKQTCGD